RDLMIPLLDDLEELAFHPARALPQDGEPARALLPLHLVERLVEDVLREAFLALLEEGDRKRLRPPHVREGPAVLGERERDEGRLERGLHQPRPEHQVVDPAFRLRPDDVRSVRDHLQDLLLRLLVHPLTLLPVRTRWDPRRRARGTPPSSRRTTRTPRSGGRGPSSRTT